MKIEFRKLRADEIDCRIGQIKDSGLSLLLYKDARCDMNVLDEAVGALNWKREHTRDNRNCIVSIWDEDKKEWVSKEDTGTESNTEAEKGLASDSFKRAGFNWGIGRELYTSPFIFVECETVKKDIGGYYIKNAEDDKRFKSLRVAKIEYNDKREITNLVIVDGQGCQVYPKPFATKQEKTLVVEKTCVCEKCGESVTEKVANYSKDKYGKVLCFDCQKKEA